MGSLLKTDAGQKNKDQVIDDGRLKIPPRVFKDEDEAATYIQACHRGHIDRTIYLPLFILIPTVCGADIPKDWGFAYDLLALEPPPG
eukprot:COSAG05_NODE_128_length_17216_cov_2576.721038_11_plen_87_part_00